MKQNVIEQQLNDLGFDKRLIRRILGGFATAENGSTVQLPDIRIAKNFRVRLVFRKSKDKKHFELSRLRFSIIRPPVVKMGATMAAASMKLDLVMREVNWQFDYRRFEKPSSPETIKRYERYRQAIQRLERLEQTPKGKMVAAYCKFEFMLGTPYEEDYISNDLIKACSSYLEFAAVKGAPTLSQVRNLLEGRYVLRNGPDAAPVWYYYNKASGKKTKGYHFFKRESSCPALDMSAQLKEILPLLGKQINPSVLQRQLENGDLVPLIATPKESWKQVYLVAEPLTAELLFKSSSDKEISRASALRLLQNAKGPRRHL